MENLTPSATGAQERIRIQQLSLNSNAIPGGPILSGSIVDYDFPTGQFSALFDVQHKGANSLAFTPNSDGSYTDTTYNLKWKLVQ